jgi:hypothetical protein
LERGTAGDFFILDKSHGELASAAWTSEIGTFGQDQPEKGSVNGNMRLNMKLNRLLMWFFLADQNNLIYGQELGRHIFSGFGRVLSVIL